MTRGNSKTTSKNEPTSSGLRGTGRARDTAARRGSIKDSVRNALWGRTAGRCTVCNRRVLNDDRTFWHSIASAEMAHIIGATATPGSPRGQEQASGTTDLESEENLLLCCHDCHRMIDHVDHVAYFTPAKLRALKAAHEQRVEMATSEGILTRTAVLRVGSFVRGSWAVASRREVADALFRNSYLGLVESHWSGQFTCELQGQAIDPGYWLGVRNQLKRSLDTVGQAVAQGDVEHVSIFAIAPVPALVLLGSLLDDKVETRIWQKHRDAGWDWLNTGEPTTFAFAQAPPSTSYRDNASRDVVLICSLSADVNPERLPEHLRRAPRFVLRPEGVTPSPTLFSHEKSLANFGAAFRDMLAAAEKAHPTATRWHLVAAAPVAASIEAGRAFMRKVQPPVEVYERTPSQNYERALTVNDIGRDSSATEHTESRS